MTRESLGEHACVTHKQRKTPGTRHELFRGKLHFLREGTADCARRSGDDLMVGGRNFSMIQRQILKVPFGIENLALFSGDDVKLGVFLG